MILSNQIVMAGFGYVLKYSRVGYSTSAASYIETRKKDLFDFNVRNQSCHFVLDLCRPELLCLPRNESSCMKNDPGII